MLKDYLKSSPIAESVHVQGNVVLHRMKLSTDDLVEIRKNGELIMKKDISRKYDLEVNGLTVAAGRIVKKKGEYYLKITDIAREGQR